MRTLLAERARHARGEYEVERAASRPRKGWVNLPLALAATISMGCATPSSLQRVAAPEVLEPFLIARYEPDYYSQTPAWTLHVAEDGRAELQLRTHGKTRWHRLPGLSPDQVQALRDRIAQADFFDLPPEIAAEEDHVPDQVLEVRVGGRHHQVRVWGACSLQDQPEVEPFLSIWVSLVEFFPSVESYESEYFDLLCREPDEAQRAHPDATVEAAEEEPPEPSPEEVDQAEQELEDARRELEEQVRREREELPRREGALPGGKVRELAREEMEEALQLCRTAPRRFVEAEVDLDAAGEAQSVELRTGSGEQDCDQAVSRALQASSWMSCQELGEPAPCRVSYALSLGSPLHQG